MKSRLIQNIYNLPLQIQEMTFMEFKRDTKHIDLNGIIELSRGNHQNVLKYLNQFMLLIPERTKHLSMHLESGNRKMIRQTLHQMSPQLQFFGIPGILVPIRRLELEYQSMPFEELNALVADILSKLELALAEVQKVIDSVNE